MCDASAAFEATRPSGRLGRLVGHRTRVEGNPTRRDRAFKRRVAKRRAKKGYR